MPTPLAYSCIGCGLHLDDCECDTDCECDDCSGCAHTDYDPDDDDGSPGWWHDDPCRRCHAEPCTCPYVCDHCGQGTTQWKLRREWYDRDTDAGAATLRLCGRCAEAEQRRVAPRAFHLARFGYGGTPRQRRLRRLHAHQRRCPECKRRRCRPDSVCGPF